MKPELSVVIPVCNEELNVLPLAREVASALAGTSIEIIFIDDGSTDGTAAAVRAARAEIPAIRMLQHARRSGQSAALCTGIRRSHGDWIATLDGDGQNDPADIPRLLAAREREGHGSVRLFIGHRVARRDTWLRRVSSRVANGVRSRMLGDATPDTGCGLKLIHRDTFLELPRFDHMHRFLPALMRRAGARVISVPVNHRERERGASKYGLFDRLWVGIVDLFGVMWLARRPPGPLLVNDDQSAG
jgi:dolichol-phosphate mannosyltransferase